MSFTPIIPVVLARAILTSFIKTSQIALFFLSEEYAVIVTSPSFSAPMTPLLLTMAMVSSLLSQMMVLSVASLGVMVAFRRQLDPTAISMIFLIESDSFYRDNVRLYRN